LSPDNRIPLNPQIIDLCELGSTILDVIERKYDPASHVPATDPARSYSQSSLMPHRIVLDKDVGGGLRACRFNVYRLIA
jgi:hypothetical protein